jgi:transposase
MPIPKPLPLQLGSTEKDGLETLIKRHKVGQQIVLRARIVLAAAEGKSNCQIARELQMSRQMVRLWRERWLQLQPIPLSELRVEERLEDLPRPGAPARITAAQRCQIEALACEQPEDSARPISQWTGREIAAEVIKRGIVEHISARHAGRLLKRGPSPTASDPLLADEQT